MLCSALGTKPGGWSEEVGRHLRKYVLRSLFAHCDATWIGSEPVTTATVCMGGAVGGDRGTISATIQN